MAEEILPEDEGRGKKKISKTTWIYIGLAAGGLVLTYLIYEHSKQSSGGSSSGSIGAPIAPGTEVAVPTSDGTYQPGTEMQAYQQGIQDALSLMQGQLGTGAESSSATTPSASSGSGTSSQTQPATSTPTTTSTPIIVPAYEPATPPSTTIIVPPYEPATPAVVSVSRYGGGPEVVRSHYTRTEATHTHHGETEVRNLSRLGLQHYYLRP